MILQLLPFVACMHLGDIKSIYRFPPPPVQIKKNPFFFNIVRWFFKIPNIFREFNQDKSKN